MVHRARIPLVAWASISEIGSTCTVLTRAGLEVAVTTDPDGERRGWLELESPGELLLRAAVVAVVGMTIVDSQALPPDIQKIVGQIL
jgi:hypothetical protein